MIFWISVIALLLLALLLLLIPLLREAKTQQTDQRREQNVQIAREKKQQLEAQLSGGQIDQAEFDTAYEELQTALALELERREEGREERQGKWMALVVLIVIPLASVAMYLTYGEYSVVQNPQLAAARSPQQTAAAPEMTLDEMHAAIRERLRDNPEDAEGWFMLGRTLMAKQQYAQAVAAYQRSNELIPEEPGILFALADAMAMQDNGNLQGEPEALIKRGLEKAPMFPNGLWLAGMAAEQRQDYAAAHDYWTRLLPLIADNPDSTREIRRLIGVLEQSDPSLAAATDATPATAELSLRIDISTELKGRADPEDAVFIYAKAVQGPPMPLAVKRMQLKDLPVEVTLSDADAMMPAMKLSSFDQVVVGARVSRSGNPVAQNGDFFAETGGIDRGNPPPRIELTIDQVK